MNLERFIIVVSIPIILFLVWAIVRCLRSDDPPHDPNLRTFRIGFNILLSLMFGGFVVFGIAYVFEPKPDLADMVTLTGKAQYAREQRIGRGTDFVIMLSGQASSLSKSSSHYDEVQDRVSRGGLLRIWIKRNDLGQVKVAHIWQLQVDDELILPFEDMVAADQDLRWFGVGVGGFAFVFLVYLVHRIKAELDAGRGERLEFS